MKVIIAGAGDIGTELAERLVADNHDVVVLEKDSDKISSLSNKLDAMVVQETGERISALMDSGIENADVFIAVTDSDELNIMYCMIAKKLANIKTVARVRNPEYTSSNMLLKSEQLGIDIMIDPEKFAALEIAKLIKNPDVSEIEYFAGGKIELVAYRADKESELINQPLTVLPVSPDYFVVGISRENGDIIIPSGEDRFMPNDVIYVIKRTGVLTEFSSMLRSVKKRVKSVMILGGGKIGFKLAKILEGYKKSAMTIKLIEKSSEKCRFLSENLNKTLVLNGDAADINFLKDENIENVDVLVSVTNSDELNILTAILGKKLGVSKVIVEINKPNYEVLMQTLEIDSFVSPRLLVAGRLAKLFRKSSVISETFLKDGSAEIVELIVSKDSPLINKQLKELRLSAKGIIVGGIIRNRKAIIPRGNDVILPQDRLLVFTQSQNLKQVEKLFCDSEYAERYGRTMMSN
ncbi:MAG TPA: Trk system potassium transporter TrkA [Thermoanaerobacterales bacterium]|uniref:Trk system potassium transporter TrkA n=1 Tax=Tepidanaerobacter sp. GT38 TaxID=2722793 RepID=UPI0017A0792F|nr:Trk system potassium transporter TrkA [Tepidanaerobacter sp. GT38]MCG1012592.1 Trk system potassium transporter TrkA [Tepidanaerobacter sp. GT38]HHY42452.1 Trk system potassium transporter TrkA [Thermoanaerobacterales bacterium]